MNSHDGFMDVPMPLSPKELNKLGMRLGAVQRKAAQVDARKQAAMVKVNERFDPLLTQLNDEADAVFSAIIAYASAHKAELTDNQTVRLDAIDIEWRTDGKGTLVFIATEEDIVRRLERLKDGSKHIIVKKSVRKDSLKADAETLAKLNTMVCVHYNDVIAVTTKPSPAQAKRGAKKFKRQQRV